ncbi:hypothetical protein CBS147320_6606 [Aspergillus niger]|nr:hypothetical protein CBS133816_2964 [Aspergillus niger]KAI2839379.1 hypothetical protein CBS11350_7634 [Aspergillus niger]KAI2867519.1 hypothetical protein CBS12448_484 [Aspergillus niger]KAI2915909.1 hypothetical protein CBS147371_5615 [Aspergillus niger]KAI2924312.1 hypothetical protein CBS147320_6606 [Aspergillus niger]
MIPAILTGVSMLAGSAYASAVQPVRATGGCANINSYYPETGTTGYFMLVASDCKNVTAPDQACPIEGFGDTSVVFRTAGETGIHEGYIAIGSENDEAKNPIICDDSSPSILNGLVETGVSGYSYQPLNISSIPYTALLMWGLPEEASVPVDFYHHYVNGTQQDGLFIGANNVTTWAIKEYSDSGSKLPYWLFRLLGPDSEDPITGAALEEGELVTYIKPNPYYDESEEFNPVYDPGLSYDLIAPSHDTNEAPPLHDLERLADLVFSSEHMLTILNNPRYLAQFREFLLEERPRSLHRLTYYLTARKALKAIDYANGLVRCVVDDAQPKSSTSGLLGQKIGEIAHPALQQRVQEALKVLTDEELPAFITSRCIGITSRVVEERVRGTLPKRFQRTDEEKGLAEVFCLTDPSRRDNPIVFASEEFHRTTQYGMDYVLGRNCRFLQGPKTNANSVRRIREAIEAGRHHSELFLNYRRDGSPFMNLLQCAPLCDSHGRVRYFIGAQIDVSGLVMDGVQMESLRDLQQQQMRDGVEVTDAPLGIQKDEFRDLSELFSPRELKVTQDIGGSLFQPVTSPALRNSSRTKWSVADGEDSVEPKAKRETSIMTVSSRPTLSIPKDIVYFAVASNSWNTTVLFPL